MLKDDITDRVASDKQSRESRQDMKKANKASVWVDRRAVSDRRKLERRLEEREERKDESYD